ncbi:hypothetical protein Q1695_011691 [Nippostrongylus brasiliensis]|nr:hypothetical protein Q1695_011691 [Nippostrongylus brasiliensis]
MAAVDEPMLGSEPANGQITPGRPLGKVRKPEDVLDHLGSRHTRLVIAIVSCSLVWGFGAMSIMSSAFTSIDCGNCTGAMITVVSEFQLRGDRAYLAEWSTSFFMVGNMLGGSSLSYAADRWGRRPLLLLCLGSQAFFAMLGAAAPSVHLFAICRLLQGACYTGANLVAWVTAYEHTHTDLRSFTTFIFGTTWVIGYSAVALLAYFSSTWNLFQKHYTICVFTDLRSFTTFIFGTTWVIGYSAVALLAYFSSTWRELMIWSAGSMFIFTLWCWRSVPETLHYLVSRRRATRIYEWLSIVDYSPPPHTDISTLLEPDDSPSPEKSSFFRELWAHKIFIAYCLIQLYLWTCDNFIYFGLSLYSTQLAGNPYANYLLMGLVEMPAYILAPIWLERFGRKLVVSGSHFLAGVCFLLPAFSEAGSWVSLACWLLGKFSISCSFMSLFVYASEVFPTPIRNVSVGLCSVLARGGAIAAPYIRLLGAIWPTSPMFLLATISIVASLLTCLLPETHRKPLPSSIRQLAPSTAADNHP